LSDREQIAQLLKPSGDVKPQAAQTEGSPGPETQSKTEPGASTPAAKPAFVLPYDDDENNFPDPNVQKK
jgi:hypothetical protein